jgi:hypothetical protein
MVQGYDALDAGDARRARECFRAADALFHVPTTAFALARADVALARLVEAHEALVAMALIPVGPHEPRDFTTARAEGATLSADLERRIPSVVISIGGTAPDDTVTVRVDGEAVPSASLDIPQLVDPGPHTVVAEAGGRATQTQVDVAEGETRAVLLVLDPPADSVAAKPARTSIGAPSWIALGVAAAGIAAGSIAGGVALSAKSDAIARGCQNDACPPPAQASAHRAETAATVSTISFGVAVIAAVVSYLVSRPSGTRSGRTALLSSAPAGFGGRF